MRSGRSLSDEKNKSDKPILNKGKRQTTRLG